MRVGDLVYCSFGPGDTGVLLEQVEYHTGYWKVLWSKNGVVGTMHQMHLEKISES